MRIYVASSWRNKHHPRIVKLLRAAGCDVYDFRNPKPGDHGFAWSDIDPEWQRWSPDQFRLALDHPIARSGFRSDLGGVNGSDVCVLVLPCGRSAHLEAGFMAGQGKPLVIYIPEACEPELMYRFAAKIVINEGELLLEVARLKGARS